MNRLYRFAPLIWLLGGLLIALFVGIRTHLDNDVRIEEAFSVMANRAANQLERRIRTYEYGLRGARGTLISTGEEKINRETFRRYSASRDIDREFPGARGFGFIRRVPHDRKAAFLRSARADGWPEFRIKELNPNPDEHFVIQYIEPVERNLQAVGLDIASESNRRSAALYAMRENRIAITKPVTLVQADGRKNNGFLILLPVYRNGMPIETEADRERAAYGWTYAPLVIDEVMAGFDYKEGHFSLRIEDVKADGGIKTFFTSENFKPENSLHLHRSIPLQIGGREWSLDIQATPRFINDLNLTSPWKLGGTISAISLLLALLTGIFQAASERSLKLANAAALHRSNERYRVVIEGAKEYAIVQLDADGYITAWNSGAENIKGYSAAEAIGQHFSVFYPEELRNTDKLRQLLTSASDIGPHEDEDWRLRKDGSRFWAAVTIAPLHDEHGQLVGYSEITRDITLRREREQALRTLSATQQAILKHAGSAIIATTETGLITLFNPSAERLLGYAADEMIGKLTPAAFHDGDEVVARAGRLSQELGVDIAPGFEAFVAKARRGLVDTNEWTYITKTGRRKAVLLSVTGLFDENRALLGFVGLAIDLSEQKRHEAELEAAREEAERATRAKSDFLANMSHEIRTPMNAILGMTQLVLQSDLQTQQRDYLSKAFSASKALLAILNDILDYSKIEAGRVELEQREMSLETTLANALSLFGAQAEQKGLELVFDAPGELPSPLIGDPLRISQVLSNLLGNAVKFTAQGVVTLKVECTQLSERISRIRFSVSDTGIGMTQAQMGQLFKPFSQADTSITRRYGGTGLGLSITKNLVDLMGGTLSVTSTQGQGSTFSFEIDLPHDEKSSQKNPALQRIGITKALIVDDQNSAAQVLKLQLNSWGVSATVTLSGTKALSLLEQAEQEGHPYDLLLLDWRMPDMDGISVVKKLEQRIAAGGLKHMPVVMMVSAYSREQLLNRIGQLRVAAVLSKPVMPSSLFNTLLGLGEDGEKGIASPSAAEHYASYREIARPLQGRRILLVEDNHLNQQVAKAFLSDAGMQVSVAENGLQALEALKIEHFDAVLMDLQMPEMDGLEATRRIRQSPDHANLPILAMTAAVLKDDQSACFAAGMNGFIAKPIEPTELIKTLCKWILPAVDQPELAGTPASPQQQPSRLSARLAQLPGIDAVAALERVAGNEALYTTLLLDFAGRCNALAGQAADLADSDQLAGLIHQIKGESANLGLHSVAELSFQLEVAMTEEDAPGTDRLLALLGDTLREMGAHITSALQPLSIAGQLNTENNGASIDLDAFNQKVAALLPLLRSQRMQAVGLARGLEATLGETDYKDEFSIILNQISQLQFKQSLELLEPFIVKVNKGN